MKWRIGAVTLAGLIGLTSFATSASAQCVPGALFDWDEGFAYETAYNPATFISTSGSDLVVVGKIVAFCGPLAGFLVPGREYTFVLEGLNSVGTTTPTATRWLTSYAPGTFSVYDDATPDAPSAAAMPAGPPNATVPSTFWDGTLVLRGNINLFNTQIVKSGANYITSLIGNYTLTGGAWWPGLQAQNYDEDGLLQGTWCANNNGTPATGLCAMPAGYSAITNSKFDQPTPVTHSTWGTIKSLYR